MDNNYNHSFVSYNDANYNSINGKKMNINRPGNNSILSTFKSTS